MWLFRRYGFRTDGQNGARTANVFSEVCRTALTSGAQSHHSRSREEPTRPKSVSGSQTSRCCRYWLQERRHQQDMSDSRNVLTPIDWIWTSTPSDTSKKAVSSRAFIPSLRIEQSLLLHTPQQTADVCQWAHNPQNCPIPWGSRPRVKHCSLSPHESVPKRHLGRFSRFYTAHPCDQQTNRHTDHATCDICCNACDTA